MYHRIDKVYKGNKQTVMLKRNLVRKREMCLCCHKNKLALLPMVAK